jgi:hypothetical protein
MTKAQTAKARATFIHLAALSQHNISDAVAA